MSLEDRARLHAALGERARLAIVDELVTSDRSPAELGDRLGVRSNLLARHLDVLEGVGLIVRTRSAADGRRKYLRLRPERLAIVYPVTPPVPRRVLFVCTQNAARSPLAAVLWQHCTGRPAVSAGTSPAGRVHRGAVSAARRAGTSLDAVVPRRLDEAHDLEAGTQVITVCDHARESTAVGDDWWHWSLPDPAVDGTRQAFDDTVARLRQRIAPFTSKGLAT